jgi:hypothetical protein
LQYASCFSWWTMELRYIGPGDSATYLQTLHGQASYEVAAKYGNNLMLLGCFNDAETASRAAAAHDGKATALYVTVNRLGKWATNPDHLSRQRRANDSDFTARRFAYLDVDSTRPPDTSATEHEHATALKRRDEIASWLTTRFNWPDPTICGDSGNGGALFYRLARNVATDTYKRAHSVVCDTFTDGAVDVDKRVTDLARLTPLFGTLKAKGSASEDRPHRTATAEINTDAGDVTADMLAALAELWKAPATPTRTLTLTDFRGMLLPQPAIDFMTNPPAPGKRNGKLFDAARSMRDAGLSEATAHELLTPVALATGLTARAITDCIRSTYRNVKASGVSLTIAEIDRWQRGIMAREWKGRTGATDYKVGIAVANIARKCAKLDPALACRDVGEAASVNFMTAAKSLKRHCITYHTLKCINLRTRETGDARRYKLIGEGVTKIDTFSEAGGAGDGLRPSLNVSKYVTPHDAATARAGGGAIVQVVAALLENDALNIAQLHRLTGRSRDSVRRVLLLLLNAEGVNRDGNTWRLTRTDEAGILSALDRVAMATGAVGRGDRRAAQHKAQRHDFHDESNDVAMVDWMRAERLRYQLQARRGIRRHAPKGVQHDSDK